LSFVNTALAEYYSKFYLIYQ